MPRYFIATTVLLIASQPLLTRGQDELVSVAAKTALERYLAEVTEIERVAADRKAAARARLEKVLDESKKFEVEKGNRYHGMLGSYANNDGRIPFIMLSVPNGENVLGDYAKRVMNGRPDTNQRLYSFQTRGHVVIPRDGTYYLETSRGYWDMKLNDVVYNLGTLPNNHRASNIELDAGIYEVEFSVGDNGGQLAEASLRIVDKKSGNELPIFVYESELKQFWDDLSFGIELTETSKWTREEHRLPAISKKLKKNRK